MEKYEKILDELGMKVSLKGYVYWVKAMYYADHLVKEKEVLKMGEVYKYIANLYNDTPLRVEKALRHSIDTTPNMRKSVQQKYNINYKINNTIMLILLVRWVHEKE